MDKIFIKDLHIQAILGVREWERKTPQEILINVIFHTEPRLVTILDDIDGCVDYSDLATRIRTLVASSMNSVIFLISFMKLSLVKVSNGQCVR